MLYVDHSSDNTPPMVIKTEPAGGSTGISVSASVYVKFSETVVEDEDFADIHIKSIFDNSVVNCVHSINSDTLTIDPVNNFANSVTYAVYLPASAVKDTEGNNLENDYVFSFTTVESASGFTVTSPNGGESWPAGAVKEITWNYAGEGCPTDARISLYKGGEYQYIIAGHVEPGAGTYSWSIPGDQAVGDDYQVRITSNSDTRVHDYSDAYFSISKPLVVSSPNGGESWPAGAVKEITWSYAGEGYPTDARISLYKGGEYQYMIAGHVEPGAGTYSWSIPGDQATGDDYQVRITSNSDTRVHDYSDAYFSISKPLVVTSPNGGESWPAG